MQLRRTVPTAISKYVKTLGFCLILTTLFAPSAQALEILVNPGPFGSPVNNPLAFFIEEGSLPEPPPFPSVDLVFTDGKSVILEPETGPANNLLVFEMFGAIVTYTGFLTNELGNEIPGTDFTGIADGDVTNKEIPAGTVWHGMHFEGDFEDAVTYTLVWEPLGLGATPLVTPEPGTAVLLGLGLVGLGVVGRKSPANLLAPSLRQPAGRL
ncbi:MAG: PEP-CTERM sorting domain-containing protein [Deltaproteobacteria bacterium]|nr:PEP-CTERM sorting domain-containing protein [Deltaproteobacteria bacterium]